MSVQLHTRLLDESPRDSIAIVYGFANTIRSDNKVDCLRNNIGIFFELENKMKVDKANCSQKGYSFDKSSYDFAEMDLLNAMTLYAKKNEATSKEIQKIASEILQLQKNVSTKSEYVQSHMHDFEKLASGNPLEFVEKKLKELKALSLALCESEKRDVPLHQKFMDSKSFLTIEQVVEKNLDALKNDKIIDTMIDAQEALLLNFASYVDRVKLSKKECALIILKILSEQIESTFVKTNLDAFKELIQC